MIDIHKQFYYHRHQVTHTHIRYYDHQMQYTQDNYKTPRHTKSRLYDSHYLP